ncbi:MAG: PEP-CTERM sorting domain-containing protein, partial [Crocosphaera sp.]
VDSGEAATRFDIKLSQMMPDEKHSVVNPNRDLSEFKVNPSIPDIIPSLESQLSNELKTLIGSDRGTNFIFFNQVSNEIQILASLVDFPLLTDSSFLVSNSFTDLHLVYRDAMGSNSGMDLGILNQGGETFFTLDASMFNPEFNTWQLTYAACNPNTNQCMEAGDDEKVPEPTSTLSLISLGILGAGATLKRKLKPSNTKIK